MLSGVMMLASCLGDDDNSSGITYYGDGAITAFSLGTLNRTYLYNNGEPIKKTTDGTDSTTTVDCSSYKMTIDQLSYAKDDAGNPTKMHPIFNTDSLPAGTDISRVVCTISSKNSGVIALMRLKKNPTDKDTLDYFNSSDSIDFTSPREFHVYSTDGTYRRRYQVKLNVHKELADSFTWHKQDIHDIMAAAEGGVKGTALTELVSGADNTLFLSVATPTVTKLYSQSLKTGGAAGFKHQRDFGAEAWQNVVAFGGKLYVLDGGKLMRSANGASWEEVSATGVSLDADSRLVASSSKLFVLTYANEPTNTSKGMRGTAIYSSADGSNWAVEALGDDAVRLPGGRLSVCEMPLKTNSDIKRLVIAGNRMAADTLSADGNAVVWGKIEDPTDDSYKWNAYDSKSKYSLPDMQSLSVMKYDGQLYAIGGKTTDGEGTPFSVLYTSNDQGISWRESSLFTLPSLSTVVNADAVAMIADSQNYVWIVNAADSSLWKMRINRLGWKQEQRAFNE